MTKADFEEKQYEQAANIELGRHHTAVFAAGQVAEAVLGYDVAARQPSTSPIWSLMDVDPPPTGLMLVPNLWQRARVQPQSATLPGKYVSLIFQYKRPSYLNQRTAKQWHRWLAPYYRFDIAPSQQTTLEHLELAVTGRAVVRYACPAYHEYTTLQQYQMGRKVLSESTFVPPSSLTGHTAWTYQTAGTIGFANSEPENIESENFMHAWEKVRLIAEDSKENLLQHLGSLVGDRSQPTQNFGDDPTSNLEFFGEDREARRQGFLDLVTFAERVGRIGATWFVADFSHPNMEVVR